MREITINGSEADRLPAGRFFLLMAAVFAVAVGYGIVLPVLPFMLERLLDGSARFAVAWHTGMMAGLYMLALFLFAPLWGRTSDRIGRRPVILLGLGGCVAALLAFGLAQTLWLAYLARALGGGMVSAVFPVTLAYISDTGSQGARARRFAWMSSASALGFLTGPVLGGWLTGVQPGTTAAPAVTGTALPFVTAAAAGSMVWLAVYRWLPEADPLPVPPALESDAGRNPATAINTLLLLALLGTFGLGSFEVALALLGKQILKLDPFHIGLIFMECSLVMAAVQLLVFAPLTRRVGFRYAVAPAFLAMAAGVWLLPAVRETASVAMLVGLVAAGSGILTPMLAYRTSLDAGTRQGAVLGRQAAAGSFGQGLGSASAGWLFGLQTAAPFWLTAGVLVVGAVVGVDSARRAARGVSNGSS